MTSSNLFRCSVCKVTYSVSSKDPDYHLLSNKIHCPNHPCLGEIVKFAKTNARTRAVKIKAIELYQARQMGFEEERAYTAEDIKKLLNGKFVLGIDLGTGPDCSRVVVYSITVEGPKVIHLGPSTQGVVITKVTEG